MLIGGTGSSSSNLFPAKVGNSHISPAILPSGFGVHTLPFFIILESFIISFLTKSVELNNNSKRGN